MRVRYWRDKPTNLRGAVTAWERMKMSVDWSNLLINIFAEPVFLVIYCSLRINLRSKHLRRKPLRGNWFPQNCYNTIAILSKVKKNNDHCVIAPGLFEAIEIIKFTGKKIIQIRSKQLMQYHSHVNYHYPNSF